MVRFGKGGPVLFNRSLVLLGPLALVIFGLIGGTWTATEKSRTTVLSSTIPTIVEIVIGCLLIGASIPPVARVQRVLFGMLGLIFRIAIGLAAVAGVVAIVLAAMRHH